MAKNYAVAHDEFVRNTPARQTPTTTPSQLRDPTGQRSPGTDMGVSAILRDRRRRSFVGSRAGIFAVLIVLGSHVVGCSSATPAPAPTASSSASSSSAVMSSSASSPADSTTASSAASSGSISGVADKEQVCAARDDLQSSVAALTSTSLLSGGTTAIKAAVDQVQTDLDALSAAAKDDYGPQLDATQSALQQLQATVSALGDGQTADNLTALGTSIAATGAAAQDLLTQLRASCGS